MINFLVIFLIFIFLIILIYIEPILFKIRLKNKNEYGSARFATKNEIKFFFRKEHINKINIIGFPIFFNKKLNKVWFDNETPHWVYLGSTGSGKSVTQVIPQCTFISSAKNRNSVFVTDPKGEIYSTTSGMFEKQGYEIITIDFRNPELSHHINILDPIISEFEQYINNEQKSLKTKNVVEKSNFNNRALGSYAETNRLITSLSDMVTKEKYKGGDPFWTNSARQLLEGIVWLFLEEYKEKNISRNQITMYNIRQFQNSTMEDKNFDKFKNYIESKNYSSKAKERLTSILSSSENTYKSITAVFGEKMSIFGDINVANVTSESDFEFNVLGKKPVVIYVIVPDEDKVYYTLVSIIVGLLYKELVKLANIQESKSLPFQVEWILDEFANCPPFTDIEAMISVARSRGMKFHFFIQSFAQLNNIYGNEVAQIILDNCGLVYLKTNTQDTADAICKRLGQKTIESPSINQSLSFQNYNGNVSRSLMARDLMTADEIKQLHHKMIIFPTKGRPVIRNTILYNKFKIYKPGAVERKAKRLRNLLDDCYTIENIDFEIKNNIFSFKKNTLNNDDKIFLKQKHEYEQHKFEILKNEMISFFDEKIDSIDLKECNNQFYMVVKLKISLKNSDVFLLKSRVLKNNYHLELKNNNQLLEIHFKGIA